jgi:hypothetical protein
VMINTESPSNVNYVTYIDYINIKKEVIIINPLKYKNKNTRCTSSLTLYNLASKLLSLNWSGMPLLSLSLAFYGPDMCLFQIFLKCDINYIF